MTQRCAKEECKRKLPLTAYACKCNVLYCQTHNAPEEHNCSYNYFEENQKRMRTNLSSIIITKKELLLETI